MNEKITKLELNEYKIDRNSLSYASEITDQEGVLKMVLLPDSFTKEKYIGAGYKVTIPSSAAIVTDSDYLYPQFRSRGINCGMMAVALDIQESELNETFYKKLVDTLLYSLPYYLSYRTRIPLFSTQYDLSYKDFISVLENGAHARLEQLNLKQEELRHMEWKGKFDSLDIDNAKHFFRKDWLHKRTVRMRHSFGKNFTGNHYFELQVVLEDSPSLGLKKGQVVAMIHSGCQSLEDVIREDLKEQFIRKNEYMHVGPEHEMYTAFFAAQNALINLISAYRATSFAIVRDIQEQVYGSTKAEIIIERGHNHVLKEERNGKKVLVYRHNAERLQKNERAIVSGNQNHHSYIVEGDENTLMYEHTIDHGLGKLLERVKEKDIATLHKVDTHRANKGIKLFNKTDSIPVYSNEIEDVYFDTLMEKNIITNKVKLRPVFNLKFAK